MLFWKFSTFLCYESFELLFKMKLDFFCVFKTLPYVELRFKTKTFKKLCKHYFSLDASCAQCPFNSVLFRGIVELFPFYCVACFSFLSFSVPSRMVAACYWFLLIRITLLQNTNVKWKQKKLLGAHESRARELTKLKSFVTWKFVPWLCLGAIRSVFSRALVLAASELIN